MTEKVSIITIFHGDKEFKFLTEDPIGKPLEGGTVIAKENSSYVVISPEKSETLLTWTEFSKAIKKAEEVTGTTGWYVPGYYEMQFYQNHLNSEDSYWTNTELDINTSYSLNIISNAPVISDKSDSYLVRTFKKVNF